jgi:hypothetical protein
MGPDTTLRERGTNLTGMTVVDPTARRSSGAPRQPTPAAN